MYASPLIRLAVSGRKTIRDPSHSCFLNCSISGAWPKLGGKEHGWEIDEEGLLGLRMWLATPGYMLCGQAAGLEHPSFF